MELKEITENVYACLQEDKGIGCSNSGLINHKEQSMVIDTFYDLPRTREMIKLYETVWTNPPKLVVNTHINAACLIRDFGLLAISSPSSLSLSALPARVSSSSSRE